MKKLFFYVFLWGCVLALAGCSWSPRLRDQLVTGDYGPSYVALGKLSRVGYTVLENLPPETGPKTEAYLPFLWGAVSDPTFDYYGGSLTSSSGREPAFLGAIPGVTPAGLRLQRGDQIVDLDGERVSSTMGMMKKLKKLKDKPFVRLGFERAGSVFYEDVPVLYFRVLVHFGLSDKMKPFYSEWLSEKDYLVVSESLLNETRSDDELAFLLAHDLAHKIGHHQRKKIDNYGFVEGIMQRGLLASALFPSYEIGSFSVEDEKVAHAQGESFMRKAGFDPGQGLALVQRMKEDPMGRGEMWFFIHSDAKGGKGSVSESSIISSPGP